MTQQITAVAVARFAHTYDVPHALRHVETYLTCLMDARFKIKACSRMTGETRDEVVLAWAIMADKYDMHELCGHCERAMMMYLEYYHDKPELIGQLSSGALQRIAKGLHFTLVALVASTQNHSTMCAGDYKSNEVGHHCFAKSTPTLAISLHGGSRSSCALIC